MEDYIYDSDQDLFETPPALLADTLPPAQDFLFYFEETSELDLSDSNTPVGQSSPPPQDRKIISQVPGYPSWYNVKYVREPAIYSYKLMDDCMEKNLTIVL
ncbi:hypothetical protein DPMN_155208 [Dreissena polymorpha]|uniref:Uncharacterized protein n=1 Tax=Dreissena polymorpha TaxID=45954 RepID=A0A9D4FPY2_DREPO|nr:hypothetical protein DPMN_155208 [Dreissena polymorpha]